MTSFNKTFIKFTLAFLAIVLLVLGATLLAQYFQNKKEINNQMAQRPDEIVITELPTGEKLVENKTQGYSVIIPNKWNTDKPEIGYLSFNDIDLKNPQNEFCKIENYSIENSKNLTVEQWLNSEDLKLNESFMTINQDKQSEIIISGRQGIKRVLNTSETGLSIAAIVSFNQKIYEFVIYPKGEHKQKCLDDFNLYLKSIKFE